MSFNSSIVKSYAGGVLTAFSAPLASYKGSQIPLNGVVSGTTASTTGLVLAVGGVNNIEFESLSAIVEVNQATASLTNTTKWQVSNDGTNWIDLFNKSCTVNVQKATTGASGLTQYVQSFDGINPSFQYVRFATLTGGATGGASDNLCVAYNWRRRFVAPIG